MISHLAARRRRPGDARPRPRRGGRRRRFAPEALEGRTLLSTFTVRNLDDGGEGSLRQAILDANAAPGADVIAFDVAGTIALTSGPLPAIAGPVDIDGTSAPGFSGMPVVEVDANGFDGLRFGLRSSGSALRYLGIVDAGGDGVTIDGRRILVVGNYIGLRPDGATAAGNGGAGIRINATSARNVIGVGGPGGAGNVISGNAGDGIAILGSSLNAIAANLIGTDARGTGGLGNAGDGIRLARGARFNRIGGNTPLPESPAGQGDHYNGKPVDGNVISGNGRNGVLMTAGAEFNRLSGNFIGTDLGGNAAIGNALDGVAIIGADNNRLVGTFQIPFSTPFLFYNVIGGNGGNGLRIRDADNTKVWTNFFGLGADNHTPVGNGLDGALIEGDSANTRFGGVIPFGNVAAANGRHGLEIRDSARGTSVGNTFAGLAAFNPDPDVGNALDGIHITATGGNTVLLTNILSGNRDDGIEISGDARGVTLTKAIAGLNTFGLTPKPNGDNGVEIGGNAHGNLVGGTDLSVIPRTTLSGNRGHGLAIVGNAHHNRVFNSLIGTDVFGASPIGNHGSGVFLGDGTHDNVIGGPREGDRNLISGNDGHGIELAGGTRRNHILGNRIGGTRGGEARFGNGGSGVSLADGTGDNTIAGNTSLANLGDGFRVGLSDRNRFLANLAERNAGYGYFVDAVLSNVFWRNRCALNGLGGSNQPGICEPAIVPTAGLASGRWESAPRLNS